MLSNNELPNTLQEAIIRFSDKDFCFNLAVSMRWKDGLAVCPRCQNTKTSFLSTRKIWKCLNCKKQFSVKVGTIFEDSPLGLDKWLIAMWLIVNAKNGISSYELGRAPLDDALADAHYAKNGISSYELGRALGFKQKTAWFVLHRIRLAMENGSIEKLSGEVECDETFIGGLAKNMHKWKREQKIKGRGSVGKTAVFGALERQGRVSANVIQDTKKKTLHNEVKTKVEAGANLFTDEWKSYRGLNESYIHEVINHSIEYVRGNIHTNGIENFWSLLKRTIKGTYVSVEPFHLGRYVAEQTFRFNERKLNDKERFLGVLKAVSGKRLTYDELRGYQTSC